MMPLQPGQIIRDHYQILEILGQGGFGAVYRARDTNLERDVAIKENLIEGNDAQRQFRKEALFLSGLSHRNLPMVLDYFILPGLGQYLVMEYVDGLDLAKMLEQAKGPLPVEQALNWTNQICEALTYLHTQSPPVIHRDIKPGNIRITPSGKAVLVDFGIAKADASGRSTTVGARAVTPGFSPPEQYGHGKTDAQSDIYALGATLYALITGQVPAESIDILVDRSLIPPAAHSVNPAVSPEISRVLEKAMEVDRSQRWQSAAEFEDALRKTSLSGDAPPVWEPTKKIGPVPAPGSAKSIWVWVTLSITAALFAWIWFGRKSPPLVGEALSVSPGIRLTDTPAATPQPTIFHTPTLLQEGAARTPTRGTIATPTRSSPGGTIAFFSDRGGNLDIYVIRPDGSGLRRMTDSPSKDSYPSWSPNGEMLAFQSNRDGGDFEIYLMEVSSRETRQLTDNQCNDFAPSFSPDGEALAYYSDCARDGNNREIFTMRTDRSQVRQLTDTGNNYSWYPFWLLGGEWIYFSSNRSGKYWIYRMTPDGSDLYQLVRGCSGVPSPLGDKLVYQELCSGSGSLFISDEDGSGEQQILDSDQYEYSDPYWSPDANWLVYKSNRNGDFDLFILDVLTRAWSELTEGPGNDIAPSWTAADW